MTPTAFAWLTLAAACAGGAVLGTRAAWPFIRYMMAAATVYLEDDDQHDGEDEDLRHPRAGYDSGALGMRAMEAEEKGTRR